MEKKTEREKRGRRSKIICLLYTVQTRCKVFHHKICKVWKLLIQKKRSYLFGGIGNNKCVKVGVPSSHCGFKKKKHLFASTVS